MTDTTHFKAVTAALETNLTSWTHLYCEQENITLGSLPPPPPPPPPALAFRTQPYEDHSDATFSMYMSAFTNSVHSKTTLAITHPNSTVPLLNHGLPPLLYLTPQPSPSAIPPPARFLKKLLKKLHKRMPVSAGVLTNLLFKYPPLSNSQNTPLLSP